MALQMRQPTIHRKTGLYQFRRRVPADLRHLHGGPREVKAPLGTKDLREAKRRFIAMAAEFDARWDMLREGVQNLDDEQVEAIVGEVYRGILARAVKNRGAWPTRSYGGLRAMGEMIWPESRRTATTMRRGWEMPTDACSRVSWTRGGS